MSIADKINSLTTARNNIRTALINKGISAADHGFEDFASDVDSIFIFDLADHVFKISLENGEYVRMIILERRSRHCRATSIKTTPP